MAINVLENAKDLGQGIYTKAEVDDALQTVQPYNSNLTGINQALTTSSSPTFVTNYITTLDLGNWTITESSGVLYFASSGSNKMKLDASGNLTVVGNITAYGTV